MVGGTPMTAQFLREINEHIIDSILEEGDDELLACIGHYGYPSMDEVNAAQAMITLQVQEKKGSRLAQVRADFEAYKKRELLASSGESQQPVSQMLSDIVSALQNEEGVPKGILVAFREQSLVSTDEGIKEIWADLVELGLIDPPKTDGQ